MAAPPSHMWYVKAAGGVWGPYPQDRVAGFVAEGRVTAETPVSPWAEGPFAPASASPEFAPLLQPRPPAAEATAPAQPPAQPPATTTTTTTPPAAEPAAAPKPAPAARGAGGPSRPLLVFAAVSAESAPDFHAALVAAGSGMAIRSGLWLVRTQEGAAAMRNRLSRGLGPDDTLLVIEAPLERAAWFNLEPARDRELRRLWGAPMERAG